jgi:excisionase family DNA binding protein
MSRDLASSETPPRLPLERELSPVDSRRGRWYSINDACVLLGVDQSTLRRWSDAGKVPVFRTPGGHRRYAEDDLRALVGDGPRRQERPRVNRQELTDRSLSNYQDAFRNGARERRWYTAYSPATQEELRRLGRRLVDQAIRYAASPASADRPRYLEEGRRIGEQYGISGARAGLSVADTVEAFLYFRSPVVQAVMSLIEEHNLAAKRAARLFVDIGQYMDHVLVAMVGSHQKAGERISAQMRRGLAPQYVDSALTDDA